MSLNRKKYYSLTSRCENNIKRHIEHYFAKEDFKRLVKFNMHISIQDAYKKMLHELSTMEDRFYTDFDRKNLKGKLIRDDWTRFVIPSIMEMLRIMYEERQYYSLSNEIQVNDESSEFDQQPSQFELCTPVISKIRLCFAKNIWREWSNERHWGPRVGVVLILMKEIGAEKLLLVTHIKNGQLNLNFPKGKPNPGESIRTGSFRECQEETGINDLSDSLQINKNDGVIMKKYPYIGPIDKRQSRAHYYVMTTTFSQYTSFRPNRKEILDIEWHSVYTLPCGDHCQIKRKYAFVNGSKIPINYHMVTLRDINGRNSSIIDILAYIDEKNGNRNGYEKYRFTHRNCSNYSS